MTSYGSCPRPPAHADEGVLSPNSHDVENYHPWLQRFAAVCGITALVLIAVYFRSLGHEILSEVRRNNNPLPIGTRDGNYRPKLKGVDDIPCSSHGPVLVLYLDGHEHQRIMAEAIAQGVLSVSLVDPWEGGVKLQTIESSSFDDVVGSSALILGSPVYNANIHPKVQDFINAWKSDVDMSNKVGAAFVSAGGISAGEEGTMLSILRSMLVFGMVVVGGEDWTSAFGASAIVYEDPFGSSATGSGNFFTEQCYQAESKVNAMFLQKAFQLGERVARLTSKLQG